MKKLFTLLIFIASALSGITHCAEDQNPAQNVTTMLEQIKAKTKENKKSILYAGLFAASLYVAKRIYTAEISTAPLQLDDAHEQFVSNVAVDGSIPVRPIVVIFAHGLGGDASQVNWYNGTHEKDFNIVGSKCISFDFPDAKNQETINLAQELDVETLRGVCSNYTTTHDIVLVGLSRGASTILNYAARYPQGIRALVVESPFTSLDSIIYNKLNQYHVGWIPGATSVATWAVNTFVFPKYDKNGMKPIDSIKILDPNIPVLFVHSSKDQLINCNNSQEMYLLRKKSGCNHVYYSELTQSPHAGYQFYKADRTKYQGAVDAFYASCGIVLP